MANHQGDKVSLSMSLNERGERNDQLATFQGSSRRREGRPPSLSTSLNERGERNDQLATFQGSSGRREGRPLFGSNMFEDPFFKDPFFTRPFGEPFKSSGLFGPDGIFDNGIFDMGRNLLDQFPVNHPQSIFSGSTGRHVPNEGGGHRRNFQIEEIPKNHNGFGNGAQNSSREPIVEHPDEDNSRGSFHREQRSPPFNSLRQAPPVQTGSNQGSSSSFFSSSVMCAGSDGPYYASQTIRRQGPNGIVEEEHQEKDSTSGRAQHRVSHGLGKKGHSIIRERKKDGHEENFERLHNLGEEEVPRFESEWETLADKNLPKWPKSTLSLPGPNLRSRSRAALPPGGSSRTNHH